MRYIRGLVTSVALAVVASGCSVYEDFTTSDFAELGGAAIVDAASEAMREVTRLRVTGQVRNHGEQYFVDLSLDRDDRCTGTLRLGGSHVDVRRIGDRAWIKGEPGSFNRLWGGALPPIVLERLGGTWLGVEGTAASRLCDVDDLLAKFEVVDLGGAGREQGTDDADRVPVSVGEETTLDGHKVVRLTASPGGSHDEIIWVRSEAPHHVVRVESTATQDGGTLSFSEIGREVDVEAPDRKDVRGP